jgi:transposase
VPKHLSVRPLTPEEDAVVQRLAHARTASARQVERAQIVWRARDGVRVPAIAREMGLCPDTVRRWLGRFNERGVDGFADAPRAGRPPTYAADQVGAAVGASLTNPQDLGLPFASWTLDRLASYLREEQGLAMSRSRIGALLQQEGVRWRTQETWFGERVDPAFAEKRGPSSPSTKRHLRIVRRSVSTKWDRRRPRAIRARG